MNSKGKANGAAIFRVLTVASAAMTLVAFLFLLRALNLNSSAQWPTAPGIIETNRLQFWAQKPSQPAYYIPVIRYSYSVNGTPHLGHRIRFADSQATMQQEPAEAWLKSFYPVGKKVLVYYDRKDPDLCTLVPGARHLIFLCSCLMGTGALCTCASHLLFIRSTKGRST